MLKLTWNVNRISVVLGKLHRNLFLLTGVYGSLAIVFIVLFMDWLFLTDIKSTYATSLPPAWWFNGDINHILGTDNNGRDIFSYLLLSYRVTITMTLQSAFYIVTVSVLINYILFFVPFLRTILRLLFRLINTIPTLLGIIIISMLLGNNLTHMLIVVTLAHFPRFIHNIYREMLKENNKTYISAYRLDGLSELKIFNHCIIPNMIPTYLTEIAILLGRNMLVITSLTFLGFCRDVANPDLGSMMFEMKHLLSSNYWAFLAPGLAITLTLAILYLINVGLFNDKVKV